MTIDVVDLSHYQPTPDWDALKGADIRGVIVKCTEGDHYVDHTFRARYDAAIAAGMPVCTYHFMRPGSIVNQLDHYISTLNPRRGERVCLDHEDNKVSLQDLEAAVQYLLSDKRGFQVTIYSGNVIKEQLGNRHSEVLAQTSLWLAQYGTANPSWPTETWPSWTLWQYSQTGRVPGIAGDVDVNKFNGDPDNVARWIGPAAQVAVPPAVPRKPAVRVAVEVPAGMDVEVTVNGVKL